MTPDEVSKVIGERVNITQAINAPYGAPANWKMDLCYYVSYHGKFIIFWTGLFDSARVLGYGNRSTNEYWIRSVN